MRLYEVSRQVGCSTRNLVNMLKENNFAVRSFMDNVSNGDYDYVFHMAGIVRDLEIDGILDSNVR
jgi:hypothetical protein